MCWNLGSDVELTRIGGKGQARCAETISLQYRGWRLAAWLICSALLLLLSARSLTFADKVGYLGILHEDNSKEQEALPVVEGLLDGLVDAAADWGVRASFQ